MPSVRWYLNRLATMTPAEVAWRAAHAGQDLLDRWRVPAGRYPRAALVGAGTPQAEPPFRVSDVPRGAWLQAGDAAAARWSGDLRRYAGELLQHRLTFFNLHAHHAGDPIDWNRDHETGRPAPRSFAPAIDYREVATAGDAKVVWEPNRHQHLAPLARAYRATGDERYAGEVIAQIESWIDQSPFGYGMNWRSPLELAIRVINWTWAIDLIRGSRAWAAAPHQRLRHVVYLHLWEITRKYSRGSSSNNHVIGEAAGVFVAAAYFADFPNAARWRDEARDVLEREILVQSHADGGTREQATGYQLFVLQFFLIAGVVARKIGRDFPGAYWERLERMLDFVRALGEGGPYPFIGDADDGYVLDLGRRGPDRQGLLGAGAVLFNRPDFLAGEDGPQEWAYWLLGAASLDAPRPPAPGPLRSRAFPDTGYYLLQAGTGGGPDSVSLVFDCGELGFGPLAAHGHADALSVLLRVGGEDVLVDPGTYDYFTYPAWRRYYRGTPAHNTVTVDGQDQSVMTGSFMWGARAAARCLAWNPSPCGGSVSGEHDGYTRLSDPVVHRRRVELDAAARTILIHDELDARGAHDIAAFFHFGEGCRAAVAADGRIAVETAGGRAVTITADPALTLSIAAGGAQPDQGWVSRGYHRRSPAPVAAARGRTKGQAAFTTRISY